MPISRGGTGTGSFCEGSIPFIENGVFSESPNIKWDNTEGDSSLTLGATGTDSFRLILDPESSLVLKHADPPGGRTIAFTRENENDGLFQITYEADDALYIMNYNGFGMRLDRQSGKVMLGQPTNETPNGTLQVQDSLGAFDHNSTLYIGGVESDIVPPPATTSTGCLVMGDSDGDGVTYITANDGVLTASSTKPSICQ